MGNAWHIWKEEICKIASRRLLWTGLLLFLAFISLRLFSERNYYSVTIDGQIYRGQEAITKDQELTAGYAGILTEEKVRQIYEDFGFSYYDEKADVKSGNFCNEFITTNMTNYNQIAENGHTGASADQNIQFLQGEAWDQKAAPLLNGTVRFDYVYGWNDLKEIYSITMMIAVFILFIIGLSPVFSEEYMLRTAAILLTTQHGKRSAIWLKMSAALSFVTFLYTAVSVYLWLIYRNVYGTQGLDASPALIGITPAAYCPADIRTFFLLSFGLGLAGMLLLTSITLAVSALCRNSFLTVVISLALFLLPYAWLQFLAALLAPFLNRTVLQVLSHIMVSMPVYLPVNWGFSFSAGEIRIHLAIALIAGGMCLLGGYKKFRNDQG